MAFLLSPVLANSVILHDIINVMTSSLPFKASGSTNPFDDFFTDTHKGTYKKDEDGETVWDDDVDECQEPDSMNDIDN